MIEDLKGAELDELKQRVNEISETILRYYEAEEESKEGSFIGIDEEKFPLPRQLLSEAKDN